MADVKSFDVELCTEIDTLIKNHKPEHTSAKKKYKSMKKIQKLFREVGENFWKTVIKISQKLAND